MIVLCYGITKSGSTLAFELTKGVLAAAGHSQRILPEGLVEQGRRINFINAVTTQRLDQLQRAVPTDRILAIKTHTGLKRPMLAELDQRVADGHLKVQAAYRDPREICLSLLDAGAQSRAQNRPAFADITTLDGAAENVTRQVSSFMRWATTSGALRLYYGAVAFELENTVRKIAAHLGVTVDDPAEICRTVTGYTFTQKNKAVPDRYKDELTVRQNETLYGLFRLFIDQACPGQDPDAWFERRRQHIRAPIAEEVER